MRRVALCALLLAAPLLAQYDRTAPEPLAPLRGTVFVGGGGTLPDEVYRRFVDLAGGDDARLVVLADHDAPVPAAFANAAVVRANGEPVAAALQLETASGVWIVGGADTSLAPALRGVIARAGVVGCNGAVAPGFDLVPGAVVDVGSTAQRRERLLTVVAAQPRLVGLGIEASTVMVLHRRFIDVLGSGSVYACIAGNGRRPPRVEQINRAISPRTQRRAGTADGATRVRGNRPWQPRRLEDLVALSRAAAARTLPKFPADAPPVPRVAKGSLMIVGGGGMPPDFMDTFLRLAGGKDALLLYVPCTESEVANVDGTLAGWRRAGATNVDFIHTKDRHEADTSAEIHDKLRRAGGLFFGGGRQWNLVDSWQHTEAHRLMHEVLARGGVIAGSSAGASIQGSYMPRGNPLGNLDPMAEGYETGLGFLTGVAIDQHFTQRNRFADLTQLVHAYPQLLGIGLDESASIIVQGSIATCVARAGRRVFLYDRTRPVVSGAPDYVALVDGQRYDLAARTIVE